MQTSSLAGVIRKAGVRRTRTRKPKWKYEKTKKGCNAIVLHSPFGHVAADATAVAGSIKGCHRWVGVFSFRSFLAPCLGFAF